MNLNFDCQCKTKSHWTDITTTYVLRAKNISEEITWHIEKKYNYLTCTIFKALYNTIMYIILSFLM